MTHTDAVVKILHDDMLYVVNPPDSLRYPVRDCLAELPLVRAERDRYKALAGESVALVKTAYPSANLTEKQQKAWIEARQGALAKAKEMGL